MLPGIDAQVFVFEEIVLAHQPCTGALGTATNHLLFSRHVLKTSQSATISGVACRLSHNLSRQFLKTSGTLHVLKIAQPIIDSYVFEHTAKTAERDAKPVGATESAELAAPFYMRFQVQEHAGNAHGLQAW